MGRTKIFISYSHKDLDWLGKLTRQLGILEREGLVELWDDRKIARGQRWATDIDLQIRDAKIAVLLISADFLNSEFIQGKEVPEILARNADDGMLLYLILVEPCAWEQVAWLAARQMTNHRALATSPRNKADEFLARVANEISTKAKADRHGREDNAAQLSSAQTTGALNAIKLLVDLVCVTSANLPDSKAKTAALREIQKALLRASNSLLQLTEEPDRS